MGKIIIGSVLMLLIFALGGYYFINSTSKLQTKEPLRNIVPIKIPPTITNVPDQTVTGDVNNTGTLDYDIQRSIDDVNSIDDFNNDTSLDNLDSEVIALTQ